MSNRKGYFIQQRKLRKQELLKIIKDNPKETKTKIRAIFSMRTGLTYKRIDQYIQELLDAGLIKINPNDTEQIQVS